MTSSMQIRGLGKLRQTMKQDWLLMCRKVAGTGLGSDAERYRQRWHASVERYLDALANAEIADDELEEEIATHTERLETGWTMTPPESPADRFKFDRHFERLLVELEVCYDLCNGHAYTGAWIFRPDVHFSRGETQGEEREALAVTGSFDTEMETPSTDGDQSGSADNRQTLDARGHQGEYKTTKSD